MAEQKQKKAGLTISLGVGPKCCCWARDDQGLWRRLLGGAAGKDQPDVLYRRPGKVHALSHAGGFAEPGPGGVSLQDLQRELTQCEVHPWLGEQAAASAGDAL